MDRNPLDDVELPGNNASPLDSVVVPDGYEPPSSFRKALTNVGGSTLSGAGRALKDVGLDSVGDAALRKGGEIQLDTQPTVQSFSDIAKHPGDYIAESAGQMAGQAGLALVGGTVGGAIGAGLGSMAGPLAPVAVPALSTAGSYIGGNLPMLAQEYGSEREQQQQKGIDDKGRALAGAAATTAIENLGGFKPGGMAGTGKKIVSDLAGKGVKEGAKILVKKAVKSGLQEAAEEIPQQYTGAYGGGMDVQNLNTPENAERAAFGAAMALPGGTLFGAGNTLVNHARAPRGPLERAAQAGGAQSQTTTGGQNGTNPETSGTPSPDPQNQQQPGASAMPDESVPFEPEQPSGSAGGAAGQGGIDLSASPHEAYRRRAELKKRLIDTRQALKTGEDPDDSLAQELAGIEAEYNALDAGLTDWEKNSEEGKAHRKEALDIKKHAAAGDTVTHPTHGEVKITNAGRTSATISTLDDQPLGEAPYHALSSLKKPQPRTEYDDAIKAAADKHGVPVEFLKAVALQESGAKQFDENGKTVKPSTSNALGVMQIIPKWHPEFDAERLANDAEYNIDAGAQFLGQLLKKHGGDQHKALQDYYGSHDAAENAKYADAVMARMGGAQTELSADPNAALITEPENFDSTQTSSPDSAEPNADETLAEVEPTLPARNQAVVEDASTALETLPSTKVQDQFPVNDVSVPLVTEPKLPAIAGQTEAQTNGFTPTHELSDGTPVVHVENNTYRDIHGDEYQDNYAEPIQQATQQLGGNDRDEPAGAVRPVVRNDGNVPEPQQAPVSSELGGGDNGRGALAPVPAAISQEIDKAAHEAATSPHNDLSEPTQAQKEAGNYKKGHITLHGLDISIENPKGSKRSGIDPGGQHWSVDMAHHYGYIKRSTGADHEHVDVFVGDRPESTMAYVVNQVDPKTGKFDEHKVMLGFENKTQARVGYLKNYTKGWKGFGSITEMPVSELKAAIESGAIRKPIHNATTENAEQAKKGTEKKITVGTKVTDSSGIIGEAVEPPKYGRVRVKLADGTIKPFKLNELQINDDTETNQGPTGTQPTLQNANQDSPGITQIDAGEQTEPAGEMAHKRGIVGGKVSPNEILTTASGRQTTPHPGSKRIKKADQWLLENASLEAESRGDNFNAKSFRSDINAKVIPQASKDAAEEYLFGQQPDIPRPLLKPLATRQANDESQNTTTQETAAEEAVGIKPSKARGEEASVGDTVQIGARIVRIDSIERHPEGGAKKVTISTVAVADKNGKFEPRNAKGKQTWTGAEFVHHSGGVYIANEAEAGKPQEITNAAPKAKKPVGSNVSDSDDLLAAIAKLGGLNRDEAKAQGIDPKALNTRGHGIKRVFTKAGRSYDEMAELLRGYHFDVPMANDLVDKVSRAINQGEKHYNPAGHERIMNLKAQERYDDEEAQVHIQIEDAIEAGDITVADLQDAFDSLDDLGIKESFTGQDAINALNDYFGIDDEQDTAEASSEKPDQEALESYTEQELADRASAEKQRLKQEESDRVKAEQKAQADRERDRLVDDMLGATPKTGDVFGMSDPLENINKPEASGNKIFTDDAAAAALDVLKKKLGTLNSGLDPELMQAGITLAGWHIEKGARTFAAYSKAMIDQLGDVVTPYLKSWYMGVKYDPRAAGFDGMDSAATVDSFNLKDLEAGNAGTTQSESVSEENPTDTQDAGTTSDSNREPVDAGLAGTDESADSGGSVSRGGKKSTGSGKGRADGSKGQSTPIADGNNPASGAESGTADDHVIDSDEIGKGGLGQKYKDNIAAIKIIKALETEGRKATAEERKQLAKYVGWGALKGVFDKNNKQWAKQHAELRELLNDDEWRSAQASIRNAHYTSPTVINAIYNAVDQLGFKGGRILEPAMGSGNFFGLMPKNLRDKSNLHGVELDNLTSRLAKALYPNAVIAASTGFQDYQVPAGYFDMAIGNPPFGDEPIVDKDRSEYSGFSIHNYFIAKMLDKVREGGIVSVIVSHSFMDTISPKAREWVAKRANLIAAVRLPDTAFKENAGTEVVTDILFFQKTSTPEENPIWLHGKDIDLLNPKTGESETIHENEYFLTNPRHILGKPTAGGKMYRAGSYTVEATGNLEDQLAGFIKELPANIYTPIEHPVMELDAADNTIPDGVKQGSYFVDANGTIKQRMNDVAGMQTSRVWTAPTRTVKGVTSEISTAAPRMKGLINLRELLRGQMRLERDPMATEKAIEANRKTLNKAYDDFVKEFKFVNDAANRKLFMDDTESALVQALEFDYDAGISKAKAEANGLEEKKPSATKADILQRRVLFPPAENINVSTGKDALLASLDTKGRVDLEYMQTVYDKSESEIIEELGDLLYNDPQTGWVMSDEYLSGDVKTKLVEAEVAAEDSQLFKRNVTALKKVIPADKLPSEIYAPIGAGWIPSDVYQQFVREITGGNSTINYVPATAQWLGEMTGNGDAGKMNSEFGTARVSAFEIFKHILQGKAVIVKDRVSDGHGGYTMVTNEEATEAARTKMDKINALWESWVWRDGEQSGRLAKIFNNKYNRTVNRKFDGGHLSLPGMSPAIRLRPSQKNAIWRAIQDRNILLDHVVGAGKTFAMASIVMEMRRLGIARKPLFVVPNHLTMQWKSDFYRLYPAANVLAAGPEDFAKDNRERLFSKIATGDFDAVIIGHSSLKKVGLDPEIEQRMYRAQIDEISSAIEDMKRERGDRNVIRDMEKIKANLEAKIQDLINKAGERDKVMSFDELGVDALLVDEMHEFKNLFFTTQKQRVAGLGNPKGSGKAIDLFFKIRWLQESLGERAPLVTATGTPVSNSLAEMFTMQRFMHYDEMRRQGLHLFDAWSNLYGEDQFVYEVAPSGVGYRISQRFSKYKNLPSLMGDYLSFADVVTLQDLKDFSSQEGKRFPVPNVDGGKPMNVVAKRSDLQRDFFGVPQILKDENGVIQYELDPEKAGIEKAKDSDKWILKSDGNGVGSYDTREDAELALVEKSLTPKVTIDPNSIVGQFNNLRKLTRRSKGKINALSLTGLANKAGLDYRLIDPGAPDFEGSKINKAVDNMLRVYHQWEKDKGTQLVFCDLSVPLSEKAKSASTEKRLYVLDDKGQLTHKRGTLHTIEGYEGFPFYLVRTGKGDNAKVSIYEPVSGALINDGFKDKKAAQEYVESAIKNERSRDFWFDLRDKYEPITPERISEYRDDNELEVAEDGSNEISLDDLEAAASSSKFSVYDDIRAKLIKSGVAPGEIAFIHDYNTPKQKAELFKRVNAGDIRFLMGSTPKLGAGTNVQKRLVGLHHIDAPWRPSDLEQREGRIIRQGNELYERDPEGFQVFIGRYATEQTYDTRRWQLLEHKASGIEQLRKYSGENEIEEISSEAANASDMKAAASGNPLILEETKLKNEVKRLTLLRKAHSDNLYAVERDKAEAKRRAEEYFPRVIENLRDLLNTAKEHPVPGDKKLLPDMAINGKKLDADKENATKAVADLIKSFHGLKQEVTHKITYRGITFELESFTNGTNLSSPISDMAFWGNVESISPSGLITRLTNFVESLESRIASAEADQQEERDKFESLSKVGNAPFDQEQALEDAKLKHREIQRKLMASTSLDAVPENERKAFMAELDGRRDRLRKLGYENAVNEAVKFSKSAQSKTGSTVADIKNWLPKRVRPLLDAGKLRVVQSVDDLPAHLRQKGTALYHKAWHGSPHDHDRFNSSKIGTGEGAQAFGYGHYFTDKKEIAEWYRKELSDINFTFKGKEYFVGQPETKVFLTLSKTSGNPSYVRSKYEELLKNKLANEIKKIKKQKLNYSSALRIEYQINELKKLSDEDIKEIQGFKPGKLYQVELAPTEDEYLDWDKPFSDQSEKVKEALKEIVFGRSEQTTGQRIYDYLEDKLDSQKKASDKLHSIGIRGIKYKAEGGKSDAYNYVIFSDEDITIIEKFSKDLAGVEGLYDSKRDELYLMADMLNRDNLMPVLSHELLHRAEATDPQLKAAIDRFETALDRSFKYAAAGRGSDAEKAAYRRVMNAKTPAADQASEYRAYLVSEHERRPGSLGGMVRKAIEDFIAAIRVALIRSGLDMGFIRSLTPADLAAMSRYGANTGMKMDKFDALTSSEGSNDIKFSRGAGPSQNGAPTGYRQWLSEENKKHADAMIYNLQDRFIDLKRQIEKVVNNGGALAESQNPYMAEELYHQRSAARVEDFYDHELTPVLQGLHAYHIGMDAFQQFLHARHAPSRNKVMAERNPNQAIIDRKLKDAKDALDALRQNMATPARELQKAVRELNKWRRAKPFKGTEAERLSLSGMNDADAKEFMSALHPIQRKRMTELADKIDAINDKSLDLMVAYGMETPDTIQALKDQWQHYVPLHRDEAHPEDGNFGHPIGRGFSVRGSGLKTATGSNAEVTNILAHIAAAREQMIRRGEKTRVTTALANFIHAHPDQDFAELDSPPMEDVLVNGLVEPRVDPLYKQRDNVVVFRAGGKDRAIVFNEHNPDAVRLALSWKNLDGVELDKVERVMARATRWFASVNTQYNVIFGLMNLARDTQGMMLNLTSTPLAGKQAQVLKLMGKTLPGLYGVARGAAGVDPAMKAMVDRFHKAGGTTGYMQMFDTIAERNRSIEKELRRMDAKGAHKLGLGVLQWLNDYNTVMENATRLAVFMAGIESGLSDAKAASIAKNITVNFNRKGAYTTKVGAFYAFFNASMQGTARMADTLTGPKGTQILAGGVLLGAITALLGMAMMGDDGWEDIPEFVRERSLIVPLADGKYFSVPMPLGFHILPNIGRKFVESAFGSKRVSPAARFGQMLSTLAGGLNPLGSGDLGQVFMPTLLDPAVALWRNKDWTGRGIYREDFNSLKPTPGFTRTKDSATGLAKVAAELINKATGGTDYTPGYWSPTPDQIDFVLVQLAGGTGRELAKTEQTIESAFTGDDLPLYKVPLAGRLIGDTRDGASERSAYYDNLKRLNLHHQEMTGLRGEVDGRTKIDRYVRDNPDAILYGRVHETQKQIDKMNKRRRMLKERGESTREIDDAMVERMKRMNDEVDMYLKRK